MNEYWNTHALLALFKTMYKFKNLSKWPPSFFLTLLQFAGAMISFLFALSYSG